VAGREQIKERNEMRLGLKVPGEVCLVSVGMGQVFVALTDAAADSECGRWLQ
jgi:hypothetical protein